jgi:hypothetical protein
MRYLLPTIGRFGGCDGKGAEYMDPRQRDRAITTMVGVLIGILLMTLFFVGGVGPW